MTDTRPLAERVRQQLRTGNAAAKKTAEKRGHTLHPAIAATLHEAANALEARKDQP